MNKQPIPEDYWEERKNWQYYQVAVSFAREFAQSARTAVDVGARDTPFLELIDWVPAKTAIDRYFMPTVAGANNLQGDFMKMQLSEVYDLAFCLQVLEHLEFPQPFTQKLLEIGKTVVISVPYKWKEGHCKWHIQDPVDEFKLREWTGKDPIKSSIVEDKNAKRLISVFEGNC